MARPARRASLWALPGWWCVQTSLPRQPAASLIVVGWLSAPKESRGAVTLFIFAIIPLPFFDVVGFAAGSLKYPIQRFAVAVLLGKIVKFSIVAAGGYWGTPVVTGLFD